MYFVCVKATKPKVYVIRNIKIEKNLEVFKLIFYTFVCYC